jgi:hypothetical protein
MENDEPKNKFKAGDLVIVKRTGERLQILGEAGRTSSNGGPWIQEYYIAKLKTDGTIDKRTTRTSRYSAIKGRRIDEPSIESLQ